MYMNIAFQIDEIKSLNFFTDSSIFIANEFQKQGYNIDYYSTQDIIYNNNELLIHATCFKINYQNNNYKILKKKIKNIKEYKIIFIRQNPLFNSTYLSTTYLLDILNNINFINKPQSIRNVNEKLSILNFPTLIPETLVCKNFLSGINFLSKKKICVIKSLYNCGGRNIKLVNNDSNGINIMNDMFNDFNFIMIQKYLQQTYNVNNKRIVIINGNIEAAIKRNNNTDFRINTILGGFISITYLTENEWQLSNLIAKFLKTKNILIAGLDIINQKLVEINVTSPTYFVTIKKLYKINLAKKLIAQLI